MEEKQSILKNKKLLIIIPVLVLIVAVVGITYAFFNYTRTGGANNLGTGSIYFLATESNERINITNFFPTATGAQPDGSNSGSMTIAVEAGTSYEYGIDYSLKAVDVSIPSGVTNIPVKVTTSAVNDTGKDIGFTGVTGETLTDNVGLGTGHVAGKANGGISGNRETGTITVTAYIDAADVAISDTYNGEETANMGTTTEWVRGRTVITTTEWNRLATTPITFKVKVEAGQGSAPVAQASPTCPGPQCVYTKSTNSLNYTISGTYTTGDYSSYGNYFLGHILEGTTIKESYACGINNGTVFCLRGGAGDESSLTDKPIYTDNVGILNTVYPSCNATTSEEAADCDGSVVGGANWYGDVYVGEDAYVCNVDYYGDSSCPE